MAENNPIDDVRIEPLSDEDLDAVAGGGVSDPSVPVDSSSGPVCCSCSSCS